LKKKPHTNPTISPGLSKFMEDIGLFYENHGIPRIGGRILALMLVTEGMLSADQIAARLQVSRGSVSTNTRLLSAIGLIEKSSIPGDRLDYYRFSPSAWENVFTMRLKAFDALQKLARQGLAILPIGETARCRLEELIEWVRLYQDLYEKVQDERLLRRTKKQGVGADS
jgi:DNA-binding MarR family transcriptional regulator